MSLAERPGSMHAAGEPDERQCLRIEVSDLELCSVGPVSREAFVVDGEAAQHLRVVQSARFSVVRRSNWSP